MFRIFFFVLACCTFGSATPGHHYSGNEDELYYILRELEHLLKRAEEPPTVEVPIVGKPSDQSSTYVHVGQQLSADLANDGNSDSNLHEGRSCSTTQSDDNPWWRVDLGAPHVISKVEIVNRGDCCSERLEGATVHIALQQEEALRQESNDLCGSPVTVDQASVPGGTVTVKCGPPVKGRFIVIGIPRSSVYLQLCEVRVWEIEPPTVEVPIVGKPSDQSSTYVHVGQQLSADLANDGNSDSNLHEGRSCSTTQSDDNPWWRVDLEDTHVISKVEIVNRGDCCSERLEGATVHIALQQEEALRQESNDLCGSPVTVDQASVPGGTVIVKCGPPVKGRFIVIGIPRSSVYLQLCEVRVWEIETTTVEVPIVGKPSDQSSTYVHVGQQLSADLANDGNSDSNLHEGRSCSTTQSGDNPWWVVDLEDTHVISKVEIVNRGDCCSERLEGATVHIAMQKEEALLEQTSDLCGSPVTAEQASVPGGTVTLKCGPPVEGRFIVIGIPRSSVYLQLCEVRVWEQEPLTAEVPNVGTPAGQSPTPVHNSQENSDSNHHEGGPCVTTDLRAYPWWMDLGAPQLVSRVKIVNSGDSCYGRLEGAIVRVKQSFLESGHQCGSPVTADQASAPGGTVIIYCYPGIEGRYVFIDSAHSQLCEGAIWNVCISTGL